MVVLILETAPPGLRGELSRWMLEVKPGVFAARLPAVVRDQLWQLVKKRCKKGATLIHTTQGEQGLRIEQYGSVKREMRDFEGLLLFGRSD